MLKYKLIVELPESSYRSLCQIAEDQHLLPADAAAAVLNNCLIKIMIRREEDLSAE